MSTQLKFFKKKILLKLTICNKNSYPINIESDGQTHYQIKKKQFYIFNLSGNLTQS